MTIPALLSHFGIDAKRYVTSGGRVIFDGVTASRGVATHHTYGAVTPIVNHRFHGDEDEPVNERTPTAWWTDPDKLARHDDAVKAAFPGFVRSSSEEAPPAWGGVIDTGRGKFTIGVFTRWDEGLPSVSLINGPRLGVPEGRRWTPSPHLYLNGSLCVAERDDWQPGEHTVATVIAWAAHWLAAYTDWRISRRWPVEGVQIDAA